jgi:hypothetical protein
MMLQSATELLLLRTASGLQVVNYRSFDTQGIPPTVTITQPPPAQVTEGEPVTIGASVTDDVQVRNVEVLLNGTVVSNSVSYPWNLTVPMPTIAANGSNQVTLQVEAIDTGGNTTLSNPITLQLVPDTTPPKLVGENISEGAIRGQTSRSFIFDFSKALDPTTVTSSSFELLGTGGTAVAPQSIELRNNNKEVEITYPTLAVGSYQYVLNEPQITDAAGNVMGASALPTDFSVQPFSIVWANPLGGAWTTATNWSTVALPVRSDTVLISLPASATVTYGSGTSAVTSISIQGGGSLSVNGGLLKVLGNLSVASGVLKLAGGTVQQALITNSGGSVVASGGTLDGVTYQGTLDMSGSGSTLYVKDGFTVGAGGATINLTGSFAQRRAPRRSTMRPSTSATTAALVPIAI